MGWLSKRRAKARTDSDIEQALRDMEEANRRVSADPRIQAVMAQLSGGRQEPAAPPSLDDLRARVSSGGLSYLMSPPVDLPEVAPEATRLFAEGVAGSITGDDASSLARFVEALDIVRRLDHKPAQVRLLYNVGVAHHKLGDEEQALAVLLEGKALAEEIAPELRRQARKLQRAEQEMKLDHPQVDTLGVPDIEDAMLRLFLEALEKVYGACGRDEEAAACHREVERLYAT